MYEIWHDNDFDLAHWLYLNSALVGHNVTLRQIPKTNKPTDLFNHFKMDSDLSILPSIKYETPDLVLIENGGTRKSKIKLVLEFMTHTPQHDHPLQRFTRIYGSAWLGIPSILLIPAKKEKLEKGQRQAYKPTVYKANPLIYHLFLKTSEITGTPTVLLMWPEDEGYLKYDKQHPTAPKIEKDVALLISIVDSIVENNDVSHLINVHMNKQANAHKYDPSGNNYDLTSGEIIKTSELVDKFAGIREISEISRILENKETFLYSPKGLKSGDSSFRTDPYAGKVCAFDILFCRDADGARIRNLVLQANKVPSSFQGSPTLIRKKHDIASCPFISPATLEDAHEHFKQYCPYTEKKQQRVYGEIPDLVIFEDGNIYASAY